MKTLKKLEGAPIRPVLTIVMDGVGLAPASEANAVKLAKTQTLDMLMAKYPMLTTLSEAVRFSLRALSSFQTPLNPARCSPPTHGSSLPTT